MYFNPMKKLLCSVAVAALLLLTNAPAFAAAQEGIAAVVNDSVITLSDVRERADLYSTDNAQQLTTEQRKTLEKQVLGRLIDEALQLQEARNLGITVSDADIAAGMDELAKQNGVVPEEFKKHLEKIGGPVRSLQSQVRASVAWSQVVRRKLRPQVDISDGEIDLALNQIASNKNKTQYHVAEIFLSVPVPIKDANVRDEAQKMTLQLTQGASFSSIAREFSKAPGAAKGGDLGWVQEGQLDAELDAALSKMHPGQISPPVRTAKGYHILLLRETRQSGGKVNTTQAASQGPLITMKQLFIPVTKKDTKKTVAAKIVQAKAMQKELTNCDAMAKKMKSFKSRDTGDLGKGPQSALPADIRALVEKLKVNELSAPVHTPTGLALLMVCSREDPADPKTAAAESPADSPDTARDDIAMKLGMKRLDQMAIHYLNDLRATAFIDKRI